jgi:hypothetical protein
MAVDIKIDGTSLEVSWPKVLFEAVVHTADPVNTNGYDVSPDSQRLLVNTAAENKNSVSMTVIVKSLAGARGN